MLRLVVDEDVTRDRRVGHARLPLREWQVFIGVATGLRGFEMAAQLGMSPNNVSTTKDRVFNRLSVNSDAEIAALAIHHGIVKVIP